MGHTSPVAETVVRTKLVVDDAGAASTLNGLRSQFASLSGARDHTQKGFQWLSNTLSTMAGVHLPNVARRMYDFASSMLTAAAQADAGDQALAGMIATMQDATWGQAREQAEAIGDELDALAMKSGQAMDDLGAAFQSMVEIGGATTEAIAESKRQLAQMATVANVLGKPTAMIAQEFSFMGDGIVRTRGNLFQLLKTTGIFGDNVKKAAGYWAAITQEDRARLLSAGLEQVSGKLAKATPIYSDLLQQLKNAAQIAKEKMGEPLMRALVPEMKRLVTWIDASRGSLEAYAKSMSRDVAKWVQAAAREIQFAWRWVLSHQEEIKKAIVEAWTFAKGVIEFAIRNKEVLALALGARAVAGSGGVAAAAGGAKKVYDMGAAGTTVGGMGMAGAAGGAAALGAFAAALGGVALAAWQGSKLMSELSADQKADVTARLEYFQQALESGRTDFRQWSAAAEEHFDHVKARFMAEADLIGLSRRQAEEMANSVRDQYEANRAMVANAERSAQQLAALQEQQNGMVDVEQQDALIAAIVGQYQAAVDAQNTGASAYIASLVSKSATLQEAFLASADMTSEGFNLLAETVQGDAVEFAEKLRNLATGARAREQAATARTPRVAFNGGQTFKIQQDFRDQDPDRIAVVFQRDILAAAERRYQSSFTSPFGT